MSIHEILLPETKPETEWVLGRALQKLSPTYWHASLQFLICMAIREWADARCCGRVGTEWRFRIAPPGEIVRPLVPDVAYLSYATLAREAPPEAFQVPLGAPTVAAEILSPDDRYRVVEHKIDTYLAAGTALVVIVDPEAEDIVCRDAAGVHRLRAGDVLTHTSMPGFSLDVAEYFERGKRR